MTPPAGDLPQARPAAPRPAPTTPLSAAPPVAGHYAALDGVRGLAILLVLMHNLNPGVPVLYFVGKLQSVVSNAGWVGVQLFFVLSGFLITGLLLDSQRAANYYTSFFTRRVLRIFPLYYGVLLFMFVVLPAVGLQPGTVARTAQHQVWLWTYLSNWAGPLGYGVHGFAHFWSLAIEEQFYLIWPFVVRRLAPRQIVAWSVGIAAAAFAIRCAMQLHGVEPQKIYQFTVCRMDALALGAGVAGALRVPQWRAALQRSCRPASWAALALLVATVPLTNGYSTLLPMTLTVGDTVLAAAFAVLILRETAGAGDDRWSALLSWGPLRALGKHSYAMYVFHLPLHIWIGEPLLKTYANLGMPGLITVYIGVMTLAVYLCAWVSYQLFERHFLRLKGRFAADRPAPPDATAAADARASETAQRSRGARQASRHPELPR